LRTIQEDGLRKIEVVIEQMKTFAASGQPVEGMEQKLSDELNALLKEAVSQEQVILKTELKLDAMPGYRPAVGDASSQAAQNDGSFDLSGLTALLSVIFGKEKLPPPIPLPTPIPFPILSIIVGLIQQLFGGNKKDNGEEEAHRNQEQIANYYRWLNELRDHETKMKATYEKAVNDLLQQAYDQKLNEINQALAEVDSACAEHTNNLQVLEQLQLRVSDEMVSLPLV